MWYIKDASGVYIRKFDFYICLILSRIGMFPGVYLQKLKQNVQFKCYLIVSMYRCYRAASIKIIQWFIAGFIIQ